MRFLPPDYMRVEPQGRGRGTYPAMPPPRTPFGRGRSMAAAAALASLGSFASACSGGGGQRGGQGGGAAAGGDSFNGDDQTGSFEGPGGGEDGGDARAGRPRRCDDAGHCSCFNVASIGQPGHTGFNGDDNTTAFTDYLNAESSARVDMFTTRPTLDAEFLNQYDVIILQWLVDGYSGYDGSGYWSFSADELAALKAWVQAGGGIISLSGYDGSSQEVTPENQLLGAVTDISYGTADVLGNSSNYCLGGSEPLSGWVQTTPIGQHIDEVGAFHGRPVDAGPKATVDCTDGTTVYAAHEDVGSGHVFVFTDEWVTYTTQWFGIDAGASCTGQSPDVVYQVPQFWYNAITYASQATMCPFTLTGPVTR